MTVNIIYLAIAFVFFLIRICIGRMVGVGFMVDQRYDDALMIKYADLTHHFAAQNAPFNELLLKDMGYPLFLNLVHWTGLQYTDILSTMWLVAAITSVILFYKATDVNRKIILLAVYVFVLFTPIAFDSWTSVRIYRNAILTPLYFIVLNMLALIFVQHFKHSAIALKKFLPFQITLGLIFSFTFYVKEDGLWLLAVLAFVTIICLIKTLLNSQSAKYKAFHAIALSLPLIIFSGVTNFYKQVNYEHFGVYEINTRTEGETGKFIELIYKIKSDERNAVNWAATDAILQAINASETLKNAPAFTNEILHSQWYGNIYDNPIKGDFLGWVICTAALRSGIFHSVVEQEEFFKQVNADIEAAFDNGTLQRDSKFQLVSSTGGRTLNEILNLHKIFFAEYAVHVILDKYEYAIVENRIFNEPQNAEEEQLIRQTADLINVNLTIPNEQSKTIKPVIRGIFGLYNLFQTVLFIMAMAGVILCTANIFQRRINFADTEFLILVIAAGSFVLSLVYAFALAWFMEFVFEMASTLGDGALRFYNLGLIPMLMTFEIFGAYLLIKILKG